jgi:hypothetical protein
LAQELEQLELKLAPALAKRDPTSKRDKSRSLLEAHLLGLHPTEEVFQAQASEA